jgi:hypothetical protein
MSKEATLEISATFANLKTGINSKVNASMASMLEYTAFSMLKWKRFSEDSQIFIIL